MERSTRDYKLSHCKCQDWNWSVTPSWRTRFASKVFTQVRNIHPTSDEYQPNQWILQLGMLWNPPGRAGWWFRAKQEFGKGQQKMYSAQMRFAFLQVAFEPPKWGRKGQLTEWTLHWAFVYWIKGKKWYSGKESLGDHGEDKMEWSLNVHAKKGSILLFKVSQCLASKRTEAQADGPLKRCWRLLGCFLLASYTQQCLMKAWGAIQVWGALVSHSRGWFGSLKQCLACIASASPRLLMGGGGASHLFLYAKGRQGTSGRRGDSDWVSGRFSFPREPGRRCKGSAKATLLSAVYVSLPA